MAALGLHNSGAHVAGFAPPSPHIYDTGREVGAGAYLRHDCRRSWTDGGRRRRKNARGRNDRSDDGGLTERENDDGDLSSDSEDGDTSSSDYDRRGRKRKGMDRSKYDGIENGRDGLSIAGKKRIARGDSPSRNRRSRSVSPTRRDNSSGRRARSSSRPSSDGGREHTRGYRPRGGVSDSSYESEDSVDGTRHRYRHGKRRRRREEDRNASSRCPVALQCTLR